MKLVRCNGSLILLFFSNHSSVWNLYLDSDTSTNYTVTQDFKPTSSSPLRIGRQTTDWYDGKMGHYKNTNSCLNKYGRCWALNACSGGDTYSITPKRKVVFKELEEN